MSETTNLKLPLIAGGQAQKHVTHNEALLILDALTQLAIETRQLNAPPVSPLEGQTYIIGATPTGPWVGKPNQIALFRSGVWLYIPPQTGWLGFLKNEGLMTYYNGNSWVAISSGSEASGRLTLSPTQAVSTSDIETTAASTLYFLPFRGNKISVLADVYGTAYSTIVIPDNGFSLSLAGLAANTNFDVFLNTTTVPTLNALAWASSGVGTSSRASPLVLRNGLMVSSLNNQHLYLGTIRTVASGQSADVVGGTSKMAQRFVWNYNNQVEREMYSYHAPFNSWTHNLSSWRRINNATMMECQFVVGLQERPFSALARSSLGQATVGAEGVVGVGFNADIVSVISERAVANHNGIDPLNGAQSPLTANLRTIPALGYNYLTACERAASGTISTYLVAYFQTGISASIHA